MKRGTKRKSVRASRVSRPKELKPAVEATRLQQPIQTALYAKLWRLGYNA